MRANYEARYPRIVFFTKNDSDGNATLIRTTTGVWQISYNAENRPVRFENTATETVITCVYDSQGRRFEKKVSVAGTITSWERYLYRDYLQIAAFDVTETESSSSSSEASGNSTYQLSTISYTLKRIIFWDPSEPVATRPLAIYLVNAQLYFPTVDLTKNVCELIDVSGTLACDAKTKKKGIQFSGSVSMTGEVAVGPGIGKVPGKRLPEKPKPNPIDKVTISKERKLPMCETNFAGNVTIEIGVRAGAIAYGEVFANRTFLVADPIKFNYGVRFGVNAFAGGEMYVNATTNAGGTIAL